MARGFTRDADLAIIAIDPHRMPLKRDFLHGTVTGYVNHGCRCDRCKTAWADYHLQRARKAGRRPRRLLRYDESVRDEYYPDKAGAVTFRPTALGQQLLDATQARTGRAPDDIIEKLLRTRAADLRFDESTGMLVER